MNRMINYKYYYVVIDNTIVYATQKQRLKPSKKDYELLLKLCRLSKNLYNVTLYETRQYFFNNNRFLSYPKAYHVIKNNENYQQMPKQVAQQTMKIVDRNFRSFFGILREKRKGNYNRLARVPNYLPKNDYFICIFVGDTVKIKQKTVRLSLGNFFTKQLNTKFIEIHLPKNIIGKKIKEVRINPKANGKRIYVEYVYEQPIEKVKLDKKRYISIDLGLDNFATLVSTNGPSVILDGRGIKSFNRWWNKEKAELQGIYDKNEIKTGRKMLTLYDRRDGYVNNMLNQYVNYIVKYCVKNQIGNIVIGEIKEIKQNQNHGKVNNQNFQMIPYFKFKQKLEAKCERYGIKYILEDEAYTSKCDCLAFEKIEKHETYSGKRVKRGLFQSSTGTVINADVNGALNLLRKVSGDSVAKRIISSGFVNNPKRVIV